jgi:hypothetical protein
VLFSIYKPSSYWGYPHFCARPWWTTRPAWWSWLIHLTENGGPPFISRAMEGGRSMGSVGAWNIFNGSQIQNIYLDELRMTSCRDVTGMRSSKGNHPQMDCFRYDQVSAFSLVSHMEWCASNMWNFGIWLENCGMQPSLCKPWFCCFKLITTDKGWSPPQPRWWHIYLYERVLNVGEHSNIIISLYNILSKDTIFAKWIHGGMAIPAAIRSCWKLLEVMFNGETVGLGIPQSSTSPTSSGSYLVKQPASGTCWTKQVSLRATKRQADPFPNFDATPYIHKVVLISLGRQKHDWSGLLVLGY